MIFCAICLLFQDEDNRLFEFDIYQEEFKMNKEYQFINIFQENDSKYLSYEFKV